MHEIELTPIERWTRLYDSSARQLCFLIVLKLSGTVNLKRLDDAVNCSIISSGWFSFSLGKDCRWRVEPLLERGITTSAGGISGFLDQEIPLESAPLFRVWTGDGHIIFKFHHLIADAVGAARFVREVIDKYNGRPPREDTGKDLVAVLPDTGSNLIEDAKAWLKNAVVPAAKLYGCAKEAGGAARYYLATISARTTEVLGVACTRSHVTINDALTGILAKTVSNWNTAAGAPGGTVRLSVAIGFSGEEYRNSFNVVSLDAGDTSGTDVHDVVRAVSRRLAVCKAKRGRNDIFSLLSLLPSRLGRALIRSKLFSTTTAFSNIGVFSEGVLRMGDLEVEDAAFMMGLPEPKQICFAVLGYRDRISFGVSYDSGCWTLEKVREFMGCYIATLGEFAGDVVVPVDETPLG